MLHQNLPIRNFLFLTRSSKEEILGASFTTNSRSKCWGEIYIQFIPYVDSAIVSKLDKISRGILATPQVVQMFAPNGAPIQFQQPPQPYKLTKDEQQQHVSSMKQHDSYNNKCAQAMTLLYSSFHDKLIAEIRILDSTFLDPPYTHVKVQNIWKHFTSEFAVGFFFQSDANIYITRQDKASMQRLVVAMDMGRP